MDSTNDILEEIGERLCEPDELEIYQAMTTEELEKLRDGIGTENRIVDEEARAIYYEAKKRVIEGMGNDGRE